MNLTDFAFKNRRIVYFLILILSLGGIVAFNVLSKLEDPEIIVKRAVVVTGYPGASPNQVELEVTKVLEDEIRTMGDLEKVTSRSLANYSEIQITLETTVKDADVEQKWDILRRKVDRASLKLPAGAYSPVVVDDFGDIYGIFYAMTADGYSYEEMNDFAEKIKRDLLTVKGVRRVQLNGIQDYAVYVEMHPAKMANLGVLPAEILLTMQGQDKVAYAGYFEDDDNRIKLEVANSFESIDDIKSVIIKGHEQDMFRIQDIATVEKRMKTPIDKKMYYNRNPSIGISVSMEDGDNIVELGKRVESKLADTKQELPIGIDFHKVFYQPDKVNTAIWQFMSNLAQSIIIVIAVLLFTMGFRSGILIGKGLIYTILSSFVVLFILGGTLQRVSLASIIVAMGMLVDNAIVVVDGILVDLNKGMEREKAMRNTAKKTALPLLGATLIAIISFLPIFFSPDTAGTYTRDLFIVLTVTLLFSWVFALTQIPLGAAKKLFPEKKDKDGNTKKPYSSFIYRVFKNVLNRAFRLRTVTIGIAVILLVIALYSHRFVKKAFFPDFTYNQVYVEYKLPETRKIERVEADLNEISDYLNSIEGVTNITMSLGGTPTRYNLVRTISENTKSYGELIVDFKDYKTMRSLKDQIQLHLTQHYPEAKARVRLYNLIVNSNYSVEALFKGNDVAVLRSLADQAKDIMIESPYSLNVTDDWEPQGKLLTVDYNQNKGRRVGINRGEVATSLLMATDGAPVSTYYEGNKQLPIIVKSVEPDGSRIKDLKDVPVWSMLPNLEVDKEDIKLIFSGSKSIDDVKKSMFSSSPLSSVSNNIDINSLEEVIRRHNGSRAIMAQSDPLPGYNANMLFKDVKPKIEQIELPTGYSLEWYGEQYDQQSAMKYIIMYTPIAFILIILILIALFNSYAKMFAIILCLPFAMIGVIPGLLITGKEFGFVAIVGVIGLSGMLIKNGVVLIDSISSEIEEGTSPFKAVFDSAIARFRPVMMASLTTILGMIPLIPDPMFGSLAVTIMFGLLIGTLVTLVLLPMFYTIFFKIKPIHDYKGE